MREVTIFRRPVAEPGVCAKCGSQNRPWFVDIGIDTVFNSNNPTGYWTDGVVYLCNECIVSLYNDVMRRWERFFDSLDEREQGYIEMPFNYDNVPPAYLEEDEVSEVEGAIYERDGYGCGHGPTDEFDNDSGPDDPGSEPDDSGTESESESDSDDSGTVPGIKLSLG